MLNKIKQVLKINTYFDKLSRNSYDNLASILIHRNFPPYTILPFTPFSLNPNTILHAINEIQINKRRFIVEFGSGISSIVLARYISENELDTKIVSIEDDLDWYDFIQSELTKYKCEQSIELYHVPLKTYNENTTWYDKNIISKIFEDKKFDFVIVDGPSARFGELTRIPAIETLLNSLAPNFTIFLDDIRRKGENKIIDTWETTLIDNNFDVNKVKSSSKVYGVLTCGKAFSSSPLSY